MIRKISRMPKSYHLLRENCSYWVVMPVAGAGNNVRSARATVKALRQMQAQAHAQLLGQTHHIFLAFLAA